MSPAKKKFFANKIPNCESSSVGRARPCQGRGRGFEPRLPLTLRPDRNRDRSVFASQRSFTRRKLKKGCSSGGTGRHARLKILCPLGRAGSSPASSTKDPDDHLDVGVFLAIKNTLRELPSLVNRRALTLRSWGFLLMPRNYGYGLYSLFKIN